MSIYKRGSVYWYKFMWNGQVIRQSTRQGNDNKARIEESKHRVRLALEQKDAEAARSRLGCTEVLTCHECERLFDAEKAVRREKHVFCRSKCAHAWAKARTVTTLRAFLMIDLFLMPRHATRQSQ